MNSEAQELEQVRDRIVELEKLLADKKKPPGTPLGMVALIMGGFLVTFGSMLAASLYITVGRTLLEEKLSPKPAPVVATGPANNFFPLSKSPTIGLAINTGEDFITVFRNANYGGVDVVAVDGTTFKPIWHAGPFTLQVNDPESTFLKRVNQHVVLANGSNLWVINIKNGYFERGLDASASLRNVCPFEDGSNKAYLDGDNQMLDLTTTTIALVPVAASDNSKTNPNPKINCDSRGPFPLCQSTNFSFPCETDHTPYLSNILPGSSITYQSDAYRFAVTRGGQGPGSFSATCSVKGSTSTLWQRELAAEGDEAKTKTEMATTFAGGKVLFGYRVEGNVKVQAHSSDGRSWLYENKDGRSLKTITGTPSRVYVALDDRLVVLAANTGAELTTIRAMP